MIGGFQPTAFQPAYQRASAPAETVGARLRGRRREVQHHESVDDEGEVVSIVTAFFDEVIR